MRYCVQGQNLTEWDGEVEMDRMGKMKVAFVAVAMLMVVFIIVADGSDATEEGTPANVLSSEGTEPITLDKIDFKDVECKVPMNGMDSAEKVKVWLEDKWIKGLDWKALTKDQNTGHPKNLIAEVVEFTPAFAGTKDKIDGIDGKQTFVIVDKLSDNLKSEMLTCIIDADPFDVTELSCEVPMSLAKDSVSVQKWVMDTWLKENKQFISGFTDVDLTVVINPTDGFKAAEAGTETNPEGKDGYFKFSLRSGEQDAVTNLVCTIIADEFRTETIESGVTFKGTVPDGAKFNVEDFVIDEKTLGTIIAAFGGSDTEFEVTRDIETKRIDIFDSFVMDRSDETKAYYSGTIVNMEGKEYLLLVGEKHYALHEINSDRWLKYNLSTGDFLEEVHGMETSVADNSRVRINGTTYVIGYTIVNENQATVVTDVEYFCFIYTLDGRAAGYAQFEGRDIHDMDSNSEFYFNKGTDPKTLGADYGCLGRYVVDGKTMFLGQVYSKNISMMCQGLSVDGKGTVEITLPRDSIKGEPLFIHFVNNAVVKGTMTVDENGRHANVSVDSFSPFIIVEQIEDTFSVEPVSAQLSSGSGDGDGGFNYLWIAAIAAVLLLIGAAVFFRRSQLQKP